ncbi:MAG: chorismate lyase [Thermodesulfobacteriota bacterium]
MKFPFVLLFDWIRGADILKDFKDSGLLPHQLLLLVSDGSLTTHLETIYACRLDVEIRESNTILLDNSTSAYLGIEPGQEAVMRVVWLKAKGKKVVYANSILPIARIDGRLLEDISRAEEPLGRLLASDYPFSMKECMEVGVVGSPGVASDLGLSKDTPFWTRRYRLSVQSADGDRAIKAMVMEIFSSELLGRPVLK